MMKPIQITIDEALLRRLDADEEVRRDGRSAVFRRAVDTYLRRRRRDLIRDRYEEGYGEGGGAELDGWADEGTWPED